MVVNTSKTKFMIFHTKGKGSGISDVDLKWDDNDPGSYDPDLVSSLERIHNGNPTSKSYKTLGVLLDEHMTLNDHFSHLRSKIIEGTFRIN
mgnify:CR=1 FL=1